MVIAGSRPAQATIAKRMMYPHGRASLSKGDAKVVESRLPQLQHAAKPHREIWDSRVNACKSSSSSSSFEAADLIADIERRALFHNDREGTPSSPSTQRQRSQLLPLTPPRKKYNLASRPGKSAFRKKSSSSDANVAKKTVSFANSNDERQPQLQRLLPNQQEAKRAKPKLPPAGGLLPPFGRAHGPPGSRKDQEELPLLADNEDDNTTAARRGGQHQLSEQALMEGLLDGVDLQVRDDFRGFTLEDFYSLTRQDMIDICGPAQGLILFRRTQAQAAEFLHRA